MNKPFKVTVSTDFHVTPERAAETLALLLVAEYDLVAEYRQIPQTKLSKLGGYDQYLRTLTDVCTLIQSPDSEAGAVVMSLFVTGWQQALLRVFAEKEGVSYPLMVELFNASPGNVPEIPANILDAWRPHVADALGNQLLLKRLAKAWQMRAATKSPSDEVAKSIANLRRLGYVVTYPSGD